MNKVILLQIPAKFITKYDIFNIFYYESKKISFFDKYYVVTDYDGHIEEKDDCRIIRIEKDLQFSSNMMSLLKYVEEDVFFVFCEDQIIEKCMKEEIEQAFSFVWSNNNVGFLRLSHNREIKFLNNHNNSQLSFDEFHRKYAYYVSLQPSIWRKEYLLMALHPGEDAWEFEINASNRIKRNLENIQLRSFGCNRTIMHCLNFYRSGKYARSCMVDYFLNHNIPIPPQIDMVYYKDKKKNEKKVLDINSYIKKIKNETYDC